MLRNALTRTVQASDIAGVAALLVHAMSDDAKRFDRSRSFVESPVKPMTLCMILEYAWKAVKKGP